MTISHRRKRSIRCSREGDYFNSQERRPYNFTFSENGPIIELLFKSGKVTGQFVKIIENEKIVMEWNSEGFNRPDEKSTKVWINLLGDEKLATVTIEHREIPTPESAQSKEKSWTRILEELG